MRRIRSSLGISGRLIGLALLATCESGHSLLDPTAPNHLSITVQPSDAVVGAAIGPAVQVTVYDLQGNPVTNATTSVTIAITSGTGTSGATLGGSLTVDAVGGVATFADLTIDKVGAGYMLTASATGLTASSPDIGRATTYAFTVSSLRWTSVPSGTTESLRSVWGSSGSDIWAVGAGMTMLHYDGTSWKTFDAPTSPTGPYILQGIWGTSSFNVWAVGPNGKILHFDGTTWSLASNAGPNLTAIWGSSSSDVWAVGIGGVILHFDGAGWSNAAGGASNLSGVWGSSPANVWAVGSGGTILHYDGTSWSSVPSVTTTGFSGVRGTAASDVWAVSAGQIVHYDGTAWSIFSSAIGCDAVWSASSSMAWGVAGGNSRILEFNGANWINVSAPINLGFNAIWGSSASNVWAVGNSGGIVHGTTIP